MSQQALPEWTEQASKQGQDPLGMQNSSTLLYQRLLPGISNVTERIRYYGYYAWLASLYAERIRDTNPEAWRHFLRRGEALYALLSAYHASHDIYEKGGVAGVDWAKGVLEKHSLASPNVPIDYNEGANPDNLSTSYLKQKWGAFGGIYRGQLLETGILREAGNHQIPVPSEQVGKALSHAFLQALGTQSEPIYKAIQTGRVTPRQLEAFDVMLPTAIIESSEERQLYEDLLFARIAGLESPAARQRRNTLKLILFLTREFNERVEDSAVRWALFSGLDPKGEALRFPDALVPHRQAWVAYQLNDLTHYALETLLQFVLDTLSPREGMTLGRLIDTVVDNLIENASWPSDWGTYLRDNMLSDVAGRLDAVIPERALAQAIHEATRRRDAVCTPQAAWDALRLLACVHHRYRADPDVANRYFDPGKAGLSRTVSTEVAFLEQYQKAPFAELVARLIQERVLHRHLTVAMRKLRYQRDYTFLFEMDNGLIRKRAQAGATLTTPRLAKALTFLNDLRLIADDGLTSRGEQCLEEAME